MPNNLIRVEIHLSCLITGAIVDTGATYSFMDAHLFKEIQNNARESSVRVSCAAAPPPPPPGGLLSGAAAVACTAAGRYIGR
jgi:hypothetical protein